MQHLRHTKPLGFQEAPTLEAVIKGVKSLIQILVVLFCKAEAQILIAETTLVPEILQGLVQVVLFILLSILLNRPWM